MKKLKKVIWLKIKLATCKISLVFQLNILLNHRLALGKKLLRLEKWRGHHLYFKRLKIQKPWAIAFPRNEIIHATDHNNRKQTDKQTDEMTNATPKTKTTVSKTCFCCAKMLFWFYLSFFYHLSVRIAGAPDYAQLTWCPIKNLIVFILFNKSSVSYHAWMLRFPRTGRTTPNEYYYLFEPEGVLSTPGQRSGGHPAAGTGGESLEKIAAVGCRRPNPVSNKFHRPCSVGPSHEWSGFPSNLPLPVVVFHKASFV